MKIMLAIAAAMPSALILTACSASPRQDSPAALASAAATGVSPGPAASQTATQTTSRDRTECAPKLLREAVVVYAAPRRDAQVLVRLEAPGPIFICEARSRWWRAMFAEPAALGADPAKREKSQFHDCQTRSLDQACRVGWIEGEPAADIPG